MFGYSAARARARGVREDGITRLVAIMQTLGVTKKGKRWDEQENMNRNRK